MKCDVPETVRFIVTQMPEQYSEILNPFAWVKSDWKSLLVSKIISLVEFLEWPEAVD